ncbi:hypothetical protein [Streptosporangium sp. NPDC004631]
MNDVDRLVAGIAPDPGPGMTPGGRELFDEITATPAAARVRRRFAGFPGLRWNAHRPAPGARRRRWRLAVPAVTGLTAALMILGWLFPGGFGTTSASAALEIKRQGDYYVITVKDLFAAPEMYEHELNARGLDIELRLEPTSPSQVGHIVVLNGDVEGLRRGRVVSEKDSITTIEASGEASGSCRWFTGCPIGLKVPVSFTGKGEIRLGREARPGEKYMILTSMGLPGEPLHCVDYINRTVDEMRPILRQHGVEPTFTFYAKKETSGPVPGDWYVHDDVMTEPGKALILIDPQPNPSPRPMDDFCPNRP